MTVPQMPFLDIGAGYRELKAEIDEAVARVQDSGWYLLGKELESFEHDFASYTGARACAGVANGLDALVLALKVLDVGPGDEVIVPSNTYIATWLAVSAVGALPVPVEPHERTYNITGEAIAAAITSRTAAILPVHLYGLPADVHGIAAVAERASLPVVYDAAQAHGAQVDGRPVGEFGTLTAWSFYPGKNLGAHGDGGAVTSNDPALIARVRRLRNYGSDEKYVNTERGLNSRLDDLQAALLSVKLRRLDEWNARRRTTAGLYLEGLADLDVELPLVVPGFVSAWHLFVVQVANRDRVRDALAEVGVHTLIHYPIPPTRQLAYADHEIAHQPVADWMAGRVLSLPLGPHQPALDTRRVIAALEHVL